MGILVKGAKVAEKTLGAGPKAAIKTARAFPKSTAFAGGTVTGVTLAHHNPQFYDSTPNKGRSLDKHPYGSYYG